MDFHAPSPKVRRDVWRLLLCSSTSSRDEKGMPVSSANSESPIVKLSPGVDGLRPVISKSSRERRRQRSYVCTERHVIMIAAM